MEYTKKDLRREIREKRVMLSAETIKALSDKICDTLMQNMLYKEASVILAYVPIKGEVDIMPMINSALSEGKTVAVPRVSGKDMSFYVIKGEDDLETGYMGIPEPKETCQLICADDALMIMPGTAFDRGLHRCGYGGGFYDRYLENRPHIKKVAVAFDFQIYEEIPYEDNDIKPDLVITETEVIFEINSEKE